MELRAPDLSAPTSSAIKRAIRAPADKPIEMQGLITSDLPAAADYPYGWIFDITAGVPKFSTGTNWLTFSLSTHIHAASAVTFSPAGNLVATNVQAAIAELDSEKGGLALSNIWSAQQTFSANVKASAGVFAQGNVGAFAWSGLGVFMDTNGSLGRLGSYDFTSGTFQPLVLAATPISMPSIGTSASAPNLHIDGSSNVLRSTYTFGTAAAQNTGTSGGNVPLLDGTNIWSNAQTFSAIPILSGGGVKFPATQAPSADANTLDDYEEGTFTPLLRFGGGSAGMTFFNQNGRYQKVGNRVHVEILFGLNAKGSSTGTADISALPFTASTTITQGCGALYATGLTTVAMPMARIVQGTSVVTLFDFQAGNAVALTDADFQSGATSISLSISYFI